MAMDFKCLVLCIFMSATAGGCIYIPLPHVNREPAREMRVIKVVDAATGKPVPEAKATSMVFPHETYPPMDGYFGQLYKKGRPSVTELRGRPNKTYRYRHARDGSLIASRHSYLGWSERASIIWTGFLIWTVNVHGHYSTTIVEAPGYQSVAVGVTYAKRHAYFEVAELMSARFFACQSFQDSRGYRPELHDGVLLIKLPTVESSELNAP